MTASTAAVTVMVPTNARVVLPDMVLVVVIGRLNESRLRTNPTRSSCIGLRR